VIKAYETYNFVYNQKLILFKEFLDFVRDAKKAQCMAADSFRVLQPACCKIFSPNVGTLKCQIVDILCKTE